MIIEYTDCHVHRIRLDFADLKELPKLSPVKSVADVIENDAKLLRVALPVITDVRKEGKLYSVLTRRGRKVWLNGYDK